MGNVISLMECVLNGMCPFVFLPPDRANDLPHMSRLNGVLPVCVCLFVYLVD